MVWTPMADVPNPIIVDAAGTAGSGYVLKAYLPGTTTSTSIAIDSTGSSPQSTLTANANGKWEVSGNEVIPHIDRKHKWGIFANATDAAANTPFYMGPFDNVEQIISGNSPVITNSIVIFETVADMVASTTLSVGDHVRTLGYFSIGDGGSNDYDIVAAGTGVDDGGVYIDLNSHQALGLFPNEIYDAAQFGAKGDDSTDNKTVFDKWTASGGKILTINAAGTYQVEATTRFTDSVSGESVPSGIRFYSGQTLILSPGVKIKQVAWAGAGSGNDDAGAILGIWSISNVSIQGNGAIVEGNFTPGGSYPSRDNSSNHGMHIANSTNVYVSDVQFTNCWGDGYTVSYLADNVNCDNAKNIHITDCSARDNRRNGASVVGCEGGTIKGGEYKDVASVANGGVSPWSGIDLEPNPGVTGLAGGNSSKVVNFTVNGVATSGNPFVGITVGPGTATPSLEITRDITIDGCSMLDGLVLTKCSKVTAVGNTIQNPKNDPSDSSALNGILMLETAYCNVSENVIFDCNGDGIKAEQRVAELNACDNNTIIGNDISQVSRKTNAAFEGIRVQGDSNLIALNKIRNAASGFQPQYAILLESTATNNNMLANDTQDAGSTGAWLDNGTNNQTISMGGTGSKRWLVNTTSNALPSASSQGVGFNDYEIRQAYTGGGNAILQYFYDGGGQAGQIEVDGSQQTKYYTTPSIFHTAGQGTPEGNVTAPVGSTYSRKDGGASTSFYVKESGTGNTGWVAK